MANTDGNQAAVPFGEWPSPITAAEVARGTVKLAFPTAHDGQVWWQEIRPDEDGRTTVVHRAADGRRRALQAPWNARTRVHEYGGLYRSGLPQSVSPARKIPPGTLPAGLSCSPTSPTSGFTWPPGWTPPTRCR
jgi:hypothetical protein